MGTITEKKTGCFHCGENCGTDDFRVGENLFCCEGCKMVFQLLDRKGLCDYYQLNERSGINRRIPVRKDKFAFLHDEKIAGRLIIFHNEAETHVTFYLPQIHCSSCLYLLENLPQLHQGVLSSRMDFTAKEIFIIFDHRLISLRELAELLTSLGYEPYISLRDLGQAPPVVSKKIIYQLGIAGFCFANIMLLSFPEYLGLDGSERSLQTLFRYLNFSLSLPVFFYSAQPFFISSWKGIRHKFMNIDGPIALAILITFCRSVYEVFSGTGPGYFDSMTGIVFLMLAGRVLQDKTYRQLAFDRDYTAYFPIAVSVLKEDKISSIHKEIPTSLPDIRCGDTLRIHNGELIPADGILTRGKALIDYSFVTGESIPVIKNTGEIVYAGGKQTGEVIEILVVKEVVQSYLTQLWNRKDKDQPSIDTEGSANSLTDSSGKNSFVHLLSRNFTFIVLAIAAAAVLYWGFHDPAKIGNAVTAILIIACPCALLLSSTFTNGNMLTILSRNRFYLRNAQIIERIADVSHIVFDKTGTLTQNGQQEMVYKGTPLTREEQSGLALLTSQSTHPLSRALAQHLEWAQKNNPERKRFDLMGFLEVPGKGLEGSVNGIKLAIGSRSYVTGNKQGQDNFGTGVYISRDRILLGHFSIANHYREGIFEMLRSLRPGQSVSVLSGDNANERPYLEKLLGRDTNLLFNQTPKNKSDYIRQLQGTGRKVMMIGDGLNDAGALQESDIGIALSDNTNHFTPASDAILEAGQLFLLPKFIRLCVANKRIIIASFIVSILYNLIGLFFAVQGNLSPLIAALLMPASSLSILLVAYGSSKLMAKHLRL
ncbi:heavy metal translocating P-type ATPase [Flavitalea flava]